MKCKLVVGLFSIITLVGIESEADLYQDSVSREPSVHEFTLLAYANMSRAEFNLKPMVWNNDLARAARWKSADEILNACGVHNSCNGESVINRVSRFYSGIYISENMASSGSEPLVTHLDWMGSPGHRANILNPINIEFGAGIVTGDRNHGFNTNSVEDFGRPARAVAIPVIPAGGVSPLREYSTRPRELIVNYHDLNSGTPRVRAFIGSQYVDLSLISGRPSDGSYGKTINFSDGCTPVVFVATRPDGSCHRWPETKAILVQAGPFSCTDFLDQFIVPDCENPNPSNLAFSQLKLALNPERVSDFSRVVIEATLPQNNNFIPTDFSKLELSSNTFGNWSIEIPRTCDLGSCIKSNSKGTVFTYKNKVTGNITLTRKKSGAWTLRVFSKHQSVRPQPGEVLVRIEGIGILVSTKVTGTMKKNAFVAEQ